MSSYNCETCGASDKVIHRTSPKGDPFAGKCADCLGGRSARTAEGQIMEAVYPEPWLEVPDEH